MTLFKLPNELLLEINDMLSMDEKITFALTCKRLLNLASGRYILKFYKRRCFTMYKRFTLYNEKINGDLYKEDKSGFVKIEEWFTHEYYTKEILNQKIGYEWKEEMHEDWSDNEILDPLVITNKFTIFKIMREINSQMLQNTSMVLRIKTVERLNPGKYKEAKRPIIIR